MKIILALKSLSKICIFLAIAFILARCGTAGMRFGSLYNVDHIPGSNQYHVYLGDEIHEDVPGYEKLKSLLLSLSEKDTVIFHMANYGGSVEAGFIILNGIALTKAKTIAKIESGVYSMGTAIACATDEIQFDPYSYIMFHRANNGTSEIQNYALQEAISQGNLRCVEKGLLPPAELKKLISTPYYEYYAYPNKRIIRDLINPPEPPEALKEKIPGIR